MKDSGSPSTPSERPPTILSEYGEGYCRVCHFIEPLNYDGKIAQHYRGTITGLTATCKGSYKTPPKVTPITSRAAAFRDTPPPYTCHECGRQTSLMVDGRVFGHSSTPSGRDSCRAGYRPPPPST